MMKALSLLVGFLSFISPTDALDAPAGTTAQDDPHRFAQIEENQIVGGGSVLSSDRFPWFVEVPKCGGGVLIAQDVILTVAQCFGGPQIGSKVILKRFRRKQSGQRRRITKLVPHPRFGSADTGRDYDFMLIKIEKTDGIDPIGINTDSNIPKVGQKLDVMGWGGTQMANLTAQKFPNTLQATILGAVSNEDCDQQYPGIHTNFRLCALEEGKGICYGDGGGPLVTKTKNPVVVGLASTTPIICASPGRSSIFSRVSKVSDWIQKTMCELTDTNICD